MRKNVAGQKIGAQMVSATDGSAFAGSVTVAVTVDAGTQATGAVGSGACTHEGNGYHTYAPAQSETNGDLLAFTFIGTGAIPSTVQLYTVDAIADAVWQEPIGDHDGVAGSAAELFVNLETDQDTMRSAVDAILIDTAVIGAAGAGLSNIPWNASWDAQVESEVADALAVYDPPTKAEVDTAVLNVSVDEIQASALADLFNTDSGTTYGAAVAGSVVKETADNAGGSALTVQAIVDGVWDEPIADHLDADSTGEALSDAAVVGGTGATPEEIADEVETRTIAAVTVLNGLADSVITANAINAGALTSAKFASGAFDAVWTVAARVLTAGTNIVLAKGTGVTGFTDISAANVNAEVVDALATDTYAEPGTGSPGATITLAAKIGYLYKFLRNKKDNTGAQNRLYGDDASTVHAVQSTTVVGDTTTVGEWEAP